MFLLLQEEYIENIPNFLYNMALTRSTHSKAIYIWYFYGNFLVFVNLLNESIFQGLFLAHNAYNFETLTFN